MLAGTGEYCICINLGIKSQHCCSRENTVFLVVPSPSPAPAQPQPRTQLGFHHNLVMSSTNTSPSHSSVADQ